MSSDKIRKNLLLDSETIKILEEYSKKKDGSKNISSAIRSMSREWKDNKFIVGIDYGEEYSSLIKCCGTNMQLTGLSLTSYPSKTEYECYTCGNKKYV